MPRRKLRGSRGRRKGQKKSDGKAEADHTPESPGAPDAGEAHDGGAEQPTAEDPPNPDWMQSAQGGAGGDGGFYRLDPEVQQYFKSVEKTLESMEPSLEEESNLFLGNVFSEIDGKEADLATDHECSRVLEKLLRQAPDQYLRVFFDKLNGRFVELFVHRFASHVCETVMTLAAVAVNREMLRGPAPAPGEGGVEGDGDKGPVLSVEQLVVNMCKVRATKRVVARAPNSAKLVCAHGRPVRVARAPHAAHAALGPSVRGGEQGRRAEQEEHQVQREEQQHRGRAAGPREGSRRSRFVRVRAARRFQGDRRRQRRRDPQLGGEPRRESRAPGPFLFLVAQIVSHECFFLVVVAVVVVVARFGSLTRALDCAAGPRAHGAGIRRRGERGSEGKARQRLLHGVVVEECNRIAPPRDDHRGGLHRRVPATIHDVLPEPPPEVMRAPVRELRRPALAEERKGQGRAGVDGQGGRPGVRGLPSKSEVRSYSEPRGGCCPFESLRGRDRGWGVQGFSRDRRREEEGAGSAHPPDGNLRVVRGAEERAEEA
ncbi:MAG: hypothetical protein BJ554DRAFT_5158 [Olpidium bornovanus]|uniref:Nucleolar protein 9 n=1 Tax=Olpidium bornovanus TaxID=278681 RepID=A0A8H7ZM09_9FUNG|nr:MAG: hypothetical protein BJ554DRAFT_5158 [Olpidium bornovanus]